MRSRIRGLWIVALLLVLVALPYLLLPWYTRRGTTPEERQAPLPGDSLVPVPETEYTLGMSIRASPTRVWPWLVQMGEGRAGFYSHEWVETLLGAEIRNLDSIVRSFQRLGLGDTIWLTPDPYLGRRGQFLVVSKIEPARWLVFRQTLPSGATGSWAFVLLPGEHHTTRLLFRRRAAAASTFDRIMGPGYVFMDRGMLQGIRERAESGRAEDGK